MRVSRSSVAMTVAILGLLAFVHLNGGMVMQRLPVRGWVTRREDHPQPWSVEDYRKWYPMMKVYISHSNHAPERRQYLESALHSMGFRNLVWCSKYDSKVLTQANIDAFYNFSTENWNRISSKTHNYVPGPGKRIDNASIANEMEMVRIWKMIDNDPDVPFALVLEDDVIPVENMHGKLLNYMTQLVNESSVWHLVFMSNMFEHLPGGHFRINYKQGKNMYRRIPPESRTMDAYLMTRQAARAFLAQVPPFHHYLDWEANYMMCTANLTVYWAWPALIVQGSICHYKSTVRDNPPPCAPQDPDNAIGWMFKHFGNKAPTSPFMDSSWMAPPIILKW